MVAGVLMVVVGSSLLAYFTWDRNWLLRYTIVPVLLGAFTATLAVTASWLEKKDRHFAGTGATLRGAAIALLPANFMAVALLAHDPQVTRKLIAVPAMTLLYLLLFGPALVRWARAVHPRLGFLGLTLLALDALVLLEPLTRVLLPVPPAVQLALLPAGFYAGFLLAAGAVVRFTRGVMDREMALERRVPWFVGAVLVITYLEVFTWVHGSLRILPRPATYAPLVILAGGLVLHVERRFLALAAQGAHAAESFLGFALVLAGILMGAGDPYVRVLCFALAGVVWLYQAAARGQPLHHWIGATLLVLAGAAVGLLPGFPRPWLPALGLGLAVAVELVALLAPPARTLLRDVCREMHLAVLLITAAVAVLAQWHYRTWPARDRRRPRRHRGPVRAPRAPGPEPALAAHGDGAARARSSLSRLRGHGGPPPPGQHDGLRPRPPVLGLDRPRPAAADAASSRRPLDRALAVRSAGPGRDGPARDRRARARRRSALDGLLPRIRRARC